MVKKTLSEKEWDQFVKELFKSFASSSLPNRGDNAKAAKALGLSVSAIEQMKSMGKGSTKSWVKLAAYDAELSQAEIRELFENLPSLLKSIRPLSEIDHLFEEFKMKYDTQEIAAMLQLMISKREVEDFIGVDIKVSKKKTAKRLTKKK
jgi:hypothetical protein